MATVDSISRPRASVVAQAMCGVSTQFLARKSGLSARIGSTETTSRTKLVSVHFSRKNELTPIIGQFTTLIGLPSRKAATLATVDSISRPRASVVAQAMCGVSTQFLACKSGLSARIGSTETTRTKLVSVHFSPKNELTPIIGQFTTLTAYLPGRPRRWPLSAPSAARTLRMWPGEGVSTQFLACKSGLSARIGSTETTRTKLVSVHFSPKNELTPIIGQFTTLIGLPSRKAATLATRRLHQPPARFPSVAQAMCGVSTQFLARKSRLSARLDRNHADEIGVSSFFAEK